MRTALHALPNSQPTTHNSSPPRSPPGWSAGQCRKPGTPSFRDGCTHPPRSRRSTRRTAMSLTSGCQNPATSGPSRRTLSYTTTSSIPGTRSPCCTSVSRSDEDIVLWCGGFRHTKASPLFVPHSSSGFSDHRSSVPFASDGCMGEEYSPPLIRIERVFYSRAEI